MKYRPILFIFFTFFSLLSQAQNKNRLIDNKLFSSYKVDSNLKGDFSFAKKWEYPWWVIKHEDGHFENSMGELISYEDTTHLYRTANVITSHQGEHPIKYVEATLKADTLILDFADLDAAYHGYLTVELVKDKFTSEWIYLSIMLEPPIKYITLKQDLIIITNQFKVGKKIKGKINIQFQELDSTSKQKPPVYFVKGLFETTIQSYSKN